MDPYRTLGVPRDSNRDDVKAAFRARVPPTHPDRGGEDSDFIQLRAAYERILADLNRRERRQADRNRPERQKNRDGNTTLRAEPANDASRAQRGDGPSDERIRKPSDSAGSRTSYLQWLRRVSAEAARRDPRRRGKWVRRLGVSCLLYLVASALIGVTITAGNAIYESTQDPRLYEVQPRYEETARKPKPEPSSRESLAIAAGLVSPFILIFILVCKYDDL